jgi:hypothetical protein
MKRMLLTYCALCLLLIGCGSSGATSDIDSKKLADLNRSAVMKDVEKLAKRAQMFFYRPAELGGGGQSFVSMAIGAISPKPTNKNGTYSIREATEARSVIIGVGLEIGNDGVSPVRISAVVTSDSIRTTVEN